MVDSTETVREAAIVLMRHGSYDETPDSVEWLRADAEEVSWLVAEGFGANSIAAVLYDLGWWDPTTETSDRAYAVAQDLGIGRE